MLFIIPTDLEHINNTSVLWAIPWILVCAAEANTFALVMSPNGDMGDSSVSGLPVWTGKSVDPMQWDNYRYAVQGYCVARGLSALVRPGYTSLRDHGDNELQDKLMGILLQTTRGVAGMVVRPFADMGGGVGCNQTIGQLLELMSIEFQLAQHAPKRWSACPLQNSVILQMTAGLNTQINGLGGMG